MFFTFENKKDTSISKEESFILDSSVFFGRGVFETILLLDNPILLEEHLKRLKKGALNLDIPFNLNKESVEEFIKEKNIKDKALKITLTEKNIIYSYRDIPYKEEDYERGFSLKLSKVIRNSTSKLTYLKSTCYVENLIEKEEAKMEGFDEVIFLNEKGEITEGATSNIFFIKDKKIYTPRVTCGLLDGIIRKWVVGNFKVEKGCYNIGDLKNSEGIFITNSLLGIMEVRSFDGKIFLKNPLIEEIRLKYKICIKDLK